MNKTAIKNFAIWARNKLIADITYKASLLGITEKDIKSPLPQSTQTVQFFDIGTKEPSSITGHEIEKRKKLVEEIQRKANQSDYSTAYKNVIEEVAYTWFNRLIAIRFMEVNDYLPSRIRVLSSASNGKAEPDLVTHALQANLDYSAYEKDRIMQLKHENKLDELFRMLFIMQCNSLNANLPGLFEKTSGYTELLLNVSITDKDGVIYHLVNDITEDDFNVSKEGQVEIIGWLYQYYNTEPKDEAFTLLKKNVKITKERIPAATQLFTPDWIVRYMVENSLGRLWLEGHPNDGLKSNWKYYLDEAEQEVEVQKQLEGIREEYKVIKPEDIKVIDPCMGSGHILVYAFDVLMQIYESCGYSQRDAAKNIVEKNLYGVDIDSRAYQLAYFAVMMKARKYDRRLFSRTLQSHIFAIEESNYIDTYSVDYFCDDDVRLKKAIKIIIEELHDAKEYGSILSVTQQNWEVLHARFDEIRKDINIARDVVIRELLPLVQLAETLAKKYEIVITNPPYLSNGGMDEKISTFCKKWYFNAKGDLGTVFIEKCIQMVKSDGYCALITMQSWMFLTSFEKLRRDILGNRIVNMLHLGPRAFAEISGEVVNTTTFVISPLHSENYLASYVRLVDYKSQDEKEEAYLVCEKLLYAKAKKFLRIPNAQIAYWTDDRLINLFEEESIADYAISDGQTKTGDNDKYLRNLWEVDTNKVAKGHRWIPHAKGGTFRRWYGNVDTVIDWSNKAREHYRSDRVARIAPEYIWFREGVCWNLIKSGERFAARFLEDTSTFNIAGPSIFFDDTNMNLYVIGLLNSIIAEKIINFLNPTLSTNIGDIYALPLLYKKDENRENVVRIVKENIQISKDDWDELEYSLNFVQHPMIRLANNNSIESTVNSWEDEIKSRSRNLMKNEQSLDEYFVDSYGLKGVFESNRNYTSTLRQYDKVEAIKSLISYAVGCMFGRFSIDNRGLIYAGDQWDSSIYRTFIPDEDNIIPITDEEYFKGDIVELFSMFIKKVYGEDTVEENLDFIASALSYKGGSSRDTIRNYFVKDFFKDHCKNYKKTPIYWLFDSGKQDGFKALVYLHRYNEDIIGNLRIDYLHMMQRIYENEIGRMQDTIENSKDSREISAAMKRKEKLIKQLQETKDYDEKIAHLALARISIDLDDGVKVNYEKIQTDTDGKKLDVLAKI